MMDKFFNETKLLRVDYDAKNQQKMAKKQSEKVYEDENLLVVKPLSYEASCFYGAGNTLRTTRKDEPIHFNTYGKTMGRLFYIIFKNKTIQDPLYKVALFFKFTPKEDESPEEPCRAWVMGDNFFGGALGADGRIVEVKSPGVRALAVPVRRAPAAAFLAGAIVRGPGQAPGSIHAG